jgi:hexosaminidase
MESCLQQLYSKIEFLVMFLENRSEVIIFDIFYSQDAMAYNKLNVLHWRIVGDEYWPLVSMEFPTLSEKV